MKRLEAFKYKLQPEGQQERQMRRFACEASAAAMLPAAGTIRSDLGTTQCRT